MAILEVTVKGRYAGNVTINRWNFIASGTPSAVSYSYAIIDAMGFVNPNALPITVPDTFLDYWRQLVSDVFIFEEASAVNIYSDIDFYSTPMSGVTGTDQSDPSPPVLAYGFRTNVTRRNVRPGQKRLVGMTDTRMESAGILTATALGLATDFANKMSETLTYVDEGQTLTFQPVVCGKEPVPNPNGGTSYKYYVDEADQLNNTATSILWSPKTTVRTQVSRQYGRGV